MALGSDSGSSLPGHATQTLSARLNGAGPLALEPFPGALGLVMIQPVQRVRDLSLSIVEHAAFPLIDLPVEHFSVEQMVLEMPVRILDEDEGGFAGV